MTGCDMAIAGAQNGPKMQCVILQSRKINRSKDQQSTNERVKEQKMANRTSHRYNRLPLLPSDPGGVQQELVVPICRHKYRINLLIPAHGMRG
jgi:hypothetical protein